MPTTHRPSASTRGPLTAVCLLALTGTLLTGCGTIEKKEPPLTAYNGEDVLVMLPMSKPYTEAGAAVKAGIEAAHRVDEKSVEGADGQPPNLSYIDSTKSGLDKKYGGAEAQLAIGPLRKPLVDVIAADVAMPTLALNRGDLSGSDRLFQFSLSPEDEARDLAEKVAKAGKKHIVVFMAQKTSWTDRILDPFVRGLAQQDKTIKTETLYLDKQGAVSDERAAEALSTATVDAVVVLTTAQQAEALIPTIKRNAPGLPIISTRLLFDGKPIKAMRDVFIVDIPWMLHAGRRDPFKPDASEYFGLHGRLYAMGIDAYRLAPSMIAAQQAPVVYSGETGKITLRQNGTVGRELSLGRFQETGLPTIVPIETLADTRRSPGQGDPDSP